VTDTSVLVAGRYRLERRIAAGGAGEVWKGADEVLGRPVAVKLLHAGYAGHPQAVARFRAEGPPCQRAVASGHRAGLRLRRGRGAVPGDGVGRRPSLAQVLERGPLDPGRVMDVVAQAAAGLQAAHRAGLVHRGIKPGNLLTGPGGQVKITDFGICHAAGSAPLTVTGTLLGTPGYLAPERVAGQAVTAAGDLYSLGVVAWECLAGTPPFTGTPVEVTIAHRDRPLPPLPGPVPAGVAALVTELTAKDPRARPDAGAVAERADRLRDALNSRSTLPLVTPPGPAGPARRPGPAAGSRVWRRAGRWPGTAAALAAGALIAAALGGAALASALSHAPARPPPAPPPASAARTVDVGSGSLAGQPLGVVRHRLQQLGLHVRVRWQPSGQDPGTVLAVQPSGPVPAGSVIVITAASQLHPEGDGHSNGNGDGHGNDKGDGGG
jgi:eukaryotic-like serine/threonine-protein kinase